MTLNKLYKGQPTEERYTTITMTRAREFLMATETNKMAGTKNYNKTCCQIVLVTNVKFL